MVRDEREQEPGLILGEEECAIYAHEKLVGDQKIMAKKVQAPGNER